MKLILRASSDVLNLLDNMLLNNMLDKIQYEK